MKKTFSILVLIFSIFFSSFHQLGAQEIFGYPVGGTSVITNCYFTNQCAGGAGNQHTGVDFSKQNGTTIIAAATGKVFSIMPLSGNNHGLGNTIILQHRLSNGNVRYSLYAHLNSINSSIIVGKVVSKGDVLGVMGASGFSCATYWCNTSCTAAVGCSNTHLHFEVKTSGVLNNPCGNGTYWGYTPGNPVNYCYENPFNYIGNSSVQVLPHPAITYPANNSSGIPQSLTLDWSSITGATNYRVQVKAATNSGWTAEDGFTSSTSTSSSIPVNNTTGTTSQFSTSLSPNTTYYWTIRVANGNTSSFYSPPVAFTTGATSCEAPTGINHSNVTSTGAQVNWQVNSTNTNNIILEYSPNGTTWVVQTLASNYFYYSITGLNSSTTYFYRLKRNCTSGGSSAYSSTHSFTTAAAPVTCGNSTLTGISGSFSDGSGNSNYADNLNCSWLIQPSGASSITISFTAFATETDHDFVKIYQGTSANGVLKASFSGSTLPATITVNAGTVFVSFVTDNSVTAAGWAATYSSSAGSSIISGGIYKLTHKGTTLCLDVAGNSSVSGANVQQWTDNGNDAQRWIVTLQADGYYKLTHKGTSQCLDVANNSPTAGANVQQWGDNGNNAQRWEISLQPDGYYKLTHKGTSLCLDVASNSSVAGANVQQWTDNGNDAQRWQMTFIGNNLQGDSNEREGLETNDFPESGFNLIPNPTTGRVNLFFREGISEEKATVQVFDLAGQMIDVIFSGEIIQLKDGLEYDASRLPSGTYIVTLLSDSGKENKQLIVLH